ncbi:hypothetical protein EJB05_47757, partial [Eragrostis curvula]
MVRCWTKEVRELWYDIDDFLDQYEHTARGSLTRSTRKNRALRCARVRSKNVKEFIKENDLK